MLRLTIYDHLILTLIKDTMNNLIEFMRQPWPWYVAGPLISVVMFLLIWFGNSFGISSNLRTMCTIMGAGKRVKYFDFNWRTEIWNLVFAVGLIGGGFIATNFLTPTSAVQLNEATLLELSALGVEAPGKYMVPVSLFSWESLGTLRGLIMLIGGGFLIGFGTRYAGGCTSGHAISGLSNFQLPSFIAVIGFFIGGLFITWLVLPSLLTL
jgi:uncharacterized membrane protein YedE/YeeE